MKLNRFLRLFIVISLLFTCFACDDDEECEDYNVPSGYYEDSRYQDGDYISVTYYNGYNHMITFTSTDGGCTWERSDYWF